MKNMSHKNACHDKMTLCAIPANVKTRYNVHKLVDLRTFTYSSLGVK